MNSLSSVRGDQSPVRRSVMRSPTATPEEVAGEPAPFPSKTIDAPIESFFPDWRLRLNRNLSRRSDSRWEPLTRVHATEAPTPIAQQGHESLLKQTSVASSTDLPGTLPPSPS
jgi:hypothetical protein